MYLVINLGLKSIRGIVFEESGAQVYGKSFPVHTTIYEDNVEQDAGEWLVLLDRILVDLQANTYISSHINRITVTTSSSCVVGLDEECEAVTKVLMVSDKRSRDICDELAAVMGGPHPALSTSAVVPKALWFKRNESEVFGKVAHWVNAGDCLTYFFTGRVVTDPLNAGKAFHDGRAYDADLLGTCALPVELLPEVHDVGTVFDIRPDLIKKYGFSADCRYVLTTYDAICAVLGSSNGRPDNACDVSGTVTSVRVVTGEPAGNTRPPLLVQPVAFLGKSVLGASNNMGGGIIEWYKQAFFESSGESAYSTMNDLAQASSPGAGGVVFLPYLMGERAPFVNHNASATFFGINRATKQSDFSRAVFESTAYVSKDLIDLIEEHGSQVNTLTVSGGLARFDLINQIKADVSLRPVNVTENFESTSTGAFLLMLLADGRFANLEEASEAVVRTRIVIQPSERRHAVYRECFALFKELNGGLGDFYERQKALRRQLVRHTKDLMENL